MNHLSVIKQRKTDLIKKISHNEILNKKINQTKNQLNSSVDALRIGQDALQFVETVSMSRRSMVKERLEGVISEALRYIYGEKYSILMDYTIKNNRSSCEFVIVKKEQEMEIKRTMEGVGGGVSDTIAVPMRLMVIIGNKETDSVMVLDESYKHLSPDLVERAAEFLSDISKKLKMQIVLCSHHEAMKDYADTIHEVSYKEGRSIVKKIK